MVAFEFFFCGVVFVSYVDISCIVSVAEYSEIGEDWDGGGGRRLWDGGLWRWRWRSAIYFTCRLVLYYSDTFYLVLVIVHFNDEDFGVWWHFGVRHFSRRPIDTFQRALVDLFVGLLVLGFPILVFLPRLGIEACTGYYDEGGCLVCC